MSSTFVLPSQPIAAPLRSLRPMARAWAGDRALVVFAAVLVALAVVFAVAGALDPRTLRGAGVWIKPLKFALSIALLAWTTALFASVVEPARRGRSLRALRATLIATGSFELGYIALKASLGEASHFNVGDPLHATMYALMGVAALALTATQPWLAWHVHRHGVATLAPALRTGIVAGLVLTFVLGAAVGMAMSAGAPPTNAGGLPLVGWTFGGGDLRPAHFVGIHAGQAIPLFAAVLVARRVDPVRGRAGVLAFAAAWTLLFVVALAAAFAGTTVVAALAIAAAA